MTSTLVERKFVRQQEKYSLVEKKELGELDKNVSPRLFGPHAYFILLYFPPTHLLRPTVYSVPKSSCLKDKLLGFIFNNYC